MTSLFNLTLTITKGLKAILFVSYLIYASQLDVK